MVTLKETRLINLVILDSTKVTYRDPEDQFVKRRAVEKTTSTAVGMIRTIEAPRLNVVQRRIEAVERQSRPI
jgi:hypothetical protein